MGAVLSADLYYTVNDTMKIMVSEVFSASLPKTPNKALPSPANITIKHIRVSIKDPSHIQVTYR